MVCERFHYCSSALVLLTVGHVTKAQFSVGFSPSSPILQNSLNPNLHPQPDRGERGSACIDWCQPTTMDKLVAPYASRMCNQWSPIQNGNGRPNAGNAFPGFWFGYNPYNGRMYGGAYGGNGGMNNVFSNHYNGFNNGFGSYGSPHVGYGASVRGYAVTSYFRPY